MRSHPPCHARCLGAQAGRSLAGWSRKAIQGGRHLRARASTLSCYVSFFFNDTATTEIYTLSLHDALPIFVHGEPLRRVHECVFAVLALESEDRKSTRLNSSHGSISYAVFCLKKKKK